MPFCYGMFWGQQDHRGKSHPPRKSNIGRGFQPKKAKR